MIQKPNTLHNDLESKSMFSEALIDTTPPGGRFTSSQNTRFGSSCTSFEMSAELNLVNRTSKTLFVNTMQLLKYFLGGVEKPHNYLTILLH